MNTKLMLTMAAVGLLGSGIVAAGPAGDDDPMPFLRAGEFMLSNGEVHGIANDDQAESYRVCVGKAEQAPRELTGLDNKTVPNVALKVMFDGQASTVMPGNCSEFHARNIKVTPNSELGMDEVLIGRYEHLG